MTRHCLPWTRNVGELPPLVPENLVRVRHRGACATERATVECAGTRCPPLGDCAVTVPAAVSGAGTCVMRACNPRWFSVALALVALEPVSGGRRTGGGPALSTTATTLLGDTRRLA